MGIWKDYICFCRELGYNLKNSFVLFPKDLIVAHKLAYQDVLNRREQERRKKMQQEERRAKRLLKKYRNLYAWKDNRFAVVVPRIYWKSKKKGTPSITVLQLIPPVWQTERVLSSLCGICNRRTNRSIRWSCRRIKSFSAEDTAIMLWRARYRGLWNDTKAEFWRK